eukprot:1623834-Pyramimonas_sp.AAC.1
MPWAPSTREKKKPSSESLPQGMPPKPCCEAHSNRRRKKHPLPQHSKPGRGPGPLRAAPRDQEVQRPRPNRWPSA